MEQFAMVALAHFMALLLPGPDFFLIARTTLRSGWRCASGACLGIALANGVFIALAFSGVAMADQDSIAMRVVQGVGLAYLLYLGQLFIRSAKKPAQHFQISTSTLDRMRWGKSFGMGFLSGLLNPKNALFYVSLAAVLADQLTHVYVGLLYGLWMVSVVLLWDMAIAVLIGNQRFLKRFESALPWLEFISGCLLILMALAMAVWSFS